jgi:tyrosine-protein phosphatase SIW14
MITMIPPENPDLPNFHKVSDDLYRGGQPTRAGFIQLQDMGIRSIINLRWEASNWGDIFDLGFRSYHLIFHEWHPEDEDVQRFLSLVGDPQNCPAFVHCLYGADRTGVMCAAYRIKVQGWTVDEAIKEMTTGYFGFHSFFANLPKFLEKYKK